MGEEGRDVMASVVNVARYVLNHVGEMTTMKLEKLVYYCQAWSLAWDGVPLFEEDFQAWENGPVCPELFATHRRQFILGPSYYDNTPPYPFTREQTETLDAVLAEYGDKQPRWLSELTHKERPWRETRQGIEPGEPCSRVIPKQLMQQYYEGLADCEEEG